MLCLLKNYNMELGVRELSPFASCFGRRGVPQPAAGDCWTQTISYTSSVHNYSQSMQLYYTLQVNTIRAHNYCKAELFLEDFRVYVTVDKSDLSGD